MLVLGTAECRSNYFHFSWKQNIFWKDGTSEHLYYRLLYYNILCIYDKTKEKWVILHALYKIADFH